MQRRETLSSKEIQAAQIKDQPAATHQMPPRVLGQSVRVGNVDAADRRPGRHGAWCRPSRTGLCRKKRSIPVLCATAYHWLDPDTRMTKAADALRPDGSLAVISAPHIAGVTEDFFVNVQRRYERFDRHVPPGLRLPTSAEISTGADEFDQSLRFGPAEFRPYEWEQNALNTLIAWSLSSALRVSASVASRLGVPTSEGRQEHSN